MVMRHRGELEVEKGLGLPRYSTYQRELYVPPQSGYVVYDVDEEAIYRWENLQWVVDAAFKYPWKVKEQWIKPAGTLPADFDLRSKTVADWSTTDTLTDVSPNRLLDALNAGNTVTANDVQGIAGLNMTFSSAPGSSHNTAIGSMRCQNNQYSASNIDVTFNQDPGLNPFCRLSTERSGVSQFVIKGGATWRIVGVTLDTHGATISGDLTDTLTIDTSAFAFADVTGVIVDVEIVGGPVLGWTLIQQGGKIHYWHATVISGLQLEVPQGTAQQYTVQRYVDGTLVAANNADRTDFFHDLTGLYEDIPQIKQIVNSPAHGLTIPTIGFVPLGTGAALAQDDVVETLFYAVAIPDVNNIEVVSNGIIDIPGHGLTIGQYYYADAVTPGTITSTKPRPESIAIAIAPDPNTIVLTDTGFQTIDTPVTAILKDNLVAFVANNADLTAGNHDRADATSGAIVNDSVTLPTNPDVGSFGQFYNDTGVDLLLAKDAGDSYLGSPVTTIPTDTLVSWRAVAANVIEVASVGVSVGGTNGIDGLNVLSGLVDPLPGDGVDGEHFINSATSTLFGPKAAGVWPAGVLLLGADGAPGTPGTNGTNGTNGIDGVDGADGAQGIQGPAGPNGSIDLLTDVDITTIPIQVGDYVEWDGANLVPVAKPIYGSEYFSAADDAVSTTGSTTFQPKLTLNFNCLGGDYVVTTAYGYNHNLATNDFEAQVLLDAAQFGEIHKQEPKDSAGTFGATGTSQRYYVTRERQITLAAGAHTLELEYRTDSGGDDSSIWEARFAVLRVS